VTLANLLPPSFANPVAWIRKNLKLQKRISNFWNSPALFTIQNHHGPPLCTWFPKKMDPGNLVAIIAISIWCQPQTSRYPSTNMQDLSNGLHGCNIFSKLDLVQGYHQIPVAAADIPKTAIITPFALFEYLFTPFWLSKRCTDFLTNDGPHHGWFGRCVFAYMGDSRVGSRTGKHTPSIWKLFQCPVHQRLAINLEKCVFAVPSL
jgi:hypothetical protein